MNSKFKCPKCSKSILEYAICEDGIVIYSCDNCEYYEEFKLKGYNNNSNNSNNNNKKVIKEMEEEKCVRCLINMNEFDKIYVLVSGGIDSTYLYDLFKKQYGDKVYPVNCFNPYEQSETLEQIKEDPNFIQIKPEEKYNYGQILKESFLQLPKARILKSAGKYHKKVFSCCYYIKHKAFLKNKLFKEPNTVVVSGIKRGDGMQRFFWLYKLQQENTFFHRHKGGQLYCYPFRDYTFRELPDISIRRLRKKYPPLKHSGCEICPVLVLFEISEDNERYIKSLKYALKLGVMKNE